MENKKIKLIFDGRILISYLYKNKNRSGIFFVAWNLLREFAKNTNLDITIFYEYQMFNEMQQLKELGIIPKNCSFIDLKDMAIPFISNYINLLFDLKQKFPKGDKKDNILKKILRYIAARSFSLYYKYAMYLSEFGNLTDYDVFFSPCNAIHPAIKKNKHVKTYLLVHDIIPIKLKDFYKGYEYQIKGMKDIIKSINPSDKYFTVSKNTKADILEHNKALRDENFVVTYLGTNENFHRETDLNKLNATKVKYNIPESKKYVFCLCTLEPRKNLLFAINNFADFVQKNNIDDLVFVLGGASWETFKDIENNKNCSKYFIKTGYIEDEDISALYSGAEMFVYPSLYEGFGLPVLEAMQCGCPVITSNVSSLPEVIGDAGIQINPKSNEEMLSAYDKMYFDKDFRQSCIDKGLKRAKIFSWNKCAYIMYKTFCEDLRSEASV